MFNGTLKYFLFAGIAILLAGVFALLQTNSELSVVMTSDAAGKGEVFYAKKYRFSQKQRLFFQYARGKTRSVLRLDANLKDLTLRLDPAVEKNVNVEIRQLVIKTPYLKKITIRGRELAQCPKYNLTVQVPTSQRYFACRSVNYDPQIFIDLKKVGKSSFYVHPVIFFFLGLLILDILVCWKRKWVIQLALSCWEKGKNNICILRKKIPWISADGWCYLFLLLLFFASYGIGFTTSSLGYAKVAGADVILHGERKLLGTYRGIRSDEYMAHGLLPAVAQYNHKPQFPLSNTSRGLAGRNFLVLHDTGAPVKHISILGRPATWGYFFSDLRRGMSWHSMFPLFFSIFAFWFFFNTLHPAKCLWNLLFALAAVFTSTSAMWSFWPAYNCAGIFLALAAVMRLLRSRKWHQVLLWGLLMGWSVSVSALTIYFPRIWPGCLVAGFLFVGWVLENRTLFLADKVKKVCGILAGVILFVLLISLWYDAVKDQIEIILNSVYPGKRIGWGGTASLWMLISAWFSCIFTVKTAFSLGGNECESQMMLLVFTVVPLLIFTWKNLNRKWLIAFSAAVLLVFFWFMYIGLSPLIAKLSLLERCQVRRMAYPVDLGFLALLSLLVHNCRGDGKISAFKMFCYSAVTFFPLLALFYLPRQDCQFLWLEDTRMMILSVIAVYIFISMTLVLRPKLGIALFLLFNIGNGIYFNPLCIAPEKIESPTVNALRAEKGREKYEGRILTFSYPLDTSLYSAVGGKTFNGHFVPEDMQIFDLLFKNLPDPERFHRQNHMCFFVRDANAPLLEASIPAYQGEIDVAVNGVRFDFTTLPIDYVVTSVVPWADVLKQNKTLRYLGKSGNRARFKVLHPVQPVGK